MEQISTIWPQWKVEEFIGKGAYGKVYKVRREEQGHVSYAAVKIIEIPQDESEIKELLYAGMDQASIHAFFQDMIRGLDNEIKVMESLKTAENIVSIENYHFEEHKDEIGWTIYIQMELLESLPHYIERIGKSSSSLDTMEIAKLGINICSALECCEQEKIIHRDIKPDNIFRNKYGTYKLGDFGVARQMEKTKGTMSQKGTSMYMAPEVYLGEGYGHTVDIYSLGITLYKLLNAGRFPFYPTDRVIRPGDSDAAMARRMRGDRMPVPCNADETLAGIVLKACEFRPEDRYQSAAVMKKELERWLLMAQYGDTLSYQSPVSGESCHEEVQTLDSRTEESAGVQPKENTWRAFPTMAEIQPESAMRDKIQVEITRREAQGSDVSEMEHPTGSGCHEVKNRKILVITVTAASVLIAGLTCILLVTQFFKNDISTSSTWNETESSRSNSDIQNECEKLFEGVKSAVQEGSVNYLEGSLQEIAESLQKNEWMFSQNGVSANVSKELPNPEDESVVAFSGEDNFTGCLLVVDDSAGTRSISVGYTDDTRESVVATWKRMGKEKLGELVTRDYSTFFAEIDAWINRDGTPSETAAEIGGIEIHSVEWGDWICQRTKYIDISQEPTYSIIHEGMMISFTGNVIGSTGFEVSISDYSGK